MVIQPLDTGNNKTVRSIRRLITSHHTRQTNHETVVEGVRLLDEVLALGLRPRVVVYSPKWVEYAEGRAYLARLQALSIHLFYVTDRLFGEISAVETPQGILAIVPMPPLKNLEFLLESGAKPLLLAVAAGIQDPGNLGTLLRTTLACGAQALAVTSGTVDPFNPKCIRASAGAAFRLPILSLDDGWREQLEGAGVTVRATAVAKGKPYYDLDWAGPTAVVLGNEGNGLDDDILMHAEVVTIPMSPAAESLNVSMAGSIVLFHAAYYRQKAGIGFSPPVMI